MRVRLLSLVLPLAAGLLLAGCGAGQQSTTAGTTSSTAASSGSPAAPSASAPIGFEGVPLQRGAELAPAGTTQTGTVDGVRCMLNEQLTYHIHAHLVVYDHGAPRTLPAGVGIPGSIAQQTPGEGPIAAGGKCIYWLHTHTSDGVIHIESPTRRIYTLGDFFDEWHQLLGPTRVAAAIGRVKAFVNGRPWSRNPRSIPLTPHAVIQLDVGAPVTQALSVSWSQTQL